MESEATARDGAAWFEDTHLCQVEGDRADEYMRLNGQSNFCLACGVGVGDECCCGGCEPQPTCPGCVARDAVLTREVPKRIAELEKAARVAHEIGRLHGIVEERVRAIRESRLKALMNGPAGWLDHVLPWRRRKF